MSEYVVHHGDCLDVLPTLAPQSVDAVVTSPPYAEQRKGTYGGVPEKQYPDWTVAWMNALRPALKPDASVIINIRPHVRGGVISDYVLRTRLALRDAGWAEIEELIWHKKSPPMGSVRRPRRSWESLHWFAQHGRPWCDPKADGKMYRHLSPGTHRGPTLGWKHIASTQVVDNVTERLSRVSDVVEVSPAFTRWDAGAFAHPAPYPVPLAAWCMNLVCPPGGTVLDPFSGSASTGIAALQSGRSYVGIEAMAEYVNASRTRLAQVPLTLSEVTT